MVRCTKVSLERFSSCHSPIPLETHIQRGLQKTNLWISIESLGFCLAKGRKYDRAGFYAGVRVEGECAQNCLLSTLVVLIQQCRNLMRLLT